MSNNPENPETPEIPETSEPTREDTQHSTTEKESNIQSQAPEQKKTYQPLRDSSIEELEQGLDAIGIGRYNLKYSLFIALLLVAFMIEVIGNAVVLPSAQCELGITVAMQGVIAAIPYIGIILTSYFHGYFIDTRGRKKMAVRTSFVAGCSAFVTAFMPNLTSFVLLKFFTSLWLAVPSALPYTFIGEIVPKEHRALLLTVVNAIQLLGSAFVPLIAWIIIPLEFEVNIGLYTFRPWRLVIIIYALFFILTATLLSYGPESPIFLFSRRNPEAALKVLQTMYAGNKKTSPDSFPIKSLHAEPLPEAINMLQCMKRQTRPFLEKAYFKYILLNGFLLFGVFIILNGLYVWVIETMTRVLSYERGDLTACELIMISYQYDKVDNICDDTLDTKAITTNAIAQTICAIIGIGVSVTVKYIGKFYVLFTCFVLIGTFCIIITFITNEMVFLILMSLLPIITLVIGPINVYCMEIYPAHMRGMAVMLCMMIGRMGSIFGSAMSRLMIEDSCHEMFYLYGFLLYVCALLSMLLPGAHILQYFSKVIRKK